MPKHSDPPLTAAFPKIGGFRRGRQRDILSTAVARLASAAQIRHVGPTAMAGVELEKRRSLRPALAFALRFMLFAGVGLTLYGFPTEHDGPVERAFGRYLAAYAKLAGAVLSWIEPNIQVNGTVIVGRVALIIVKYCDAMDVTLLFGAATLALEARLRDRMLALALGVLAIIALNVVRICSLYFVRRDFPQAFDTIHLEVWPPLMVVVTTLLFFVVSRRLADLSQVNHAAA